MDLGAYRGRRTLITGGRGFLARHLAAALEEAGATVILAQRDRLEGRLPHTVRTVDLQDRSACRAAMKGIEDVFHLAAVGWGFHENLKRQPELLTENVILNSTVLDAAFQAGVSRFLFTSSSAVYAEGTAILDEDQPWTHPPHPGEAGFGEAKRLGEIQARCFWERHGFPVAIVRPFNPYGPWDHTDPDRSHVVPALIRRALAGERPFSVWGTGQPVRSFIHARDVARGMMLALAARPDATPFNLGSATGTSVAELVRQVLEATGRSGEPIVFDTSKPDGPPLKVPAMQRAQNLLDFEPRISLPEGLAETVQWFRSIPSLEHP